MKPRIRLRLVEAPASQGPLSIDEKRAHAIAYLRRQGKYVLDHGTPAPKWGVPQPGAKK